MPSISRRRHAPKGPIKTTDAMERPHPMDGQCTARSKQSGVRCKRIAIQGGTVCHMHGGAAPQVKRAATERLLAFQEPALAALIELIQQTEFPSVRYAAARDVLDRTLGKAIEAVTVDHSGEVAFRWKTKDEK